MQIERDSPSWPIAANDRLGCADCVKTRKLSEDGASGTNFYAPPSPYWPKTAESGLKFISRGSAVRVFTRAGSRGALGADYQAPGFAINAAADPDPSPDTPDRRSGTIRARG